MIKNVSSKLAISRIQELITQETGKPLSKLLLAKAESIIQEAYENDYSQWEDDFVDCEVTILLADLRGFTSLTATLPAVTVTHTLNRFLVRMSEIISHHNGVIDKFMGDAILVLFGVPKKESDDVQRALTCAIEMQLAMSDLNLHSRQDSIPEFFMGIGINTGRVTAGKFGSDFYSQFTVIGDAVNLTSRIEAFSLRGQVLISQSTFNQCMDFIQVSEEIEVFVKGKTEPTKFRELYAIPSLNLKIPQIDIRSSHRVAVSLPCSFSLVENKCVSSNISPGIIRDIAYRGILLEVDQPLNKFDDVKISFDLLLIDYKAQDIYAKVVKVKEEGNRYFAGLEFTSLSPETTMKIQLFVQLLVTSNGS
jgi:adenylate cyclase